MEDDDEQRDDVHDDEHGRSDPERRDEAFFTAGNAHLHQ